MFPVNHVVHLSFSSHLIVESHFSTPLLKSCSFVTHCRASYLVWDSSNAHPIHARDHLVWHLGDRVDLVGKSGTQFSFHLHQVENVFHADTISSSALISELGQVLLISDAVPPALQALDVAWWIAPWWEEVVESDEYILILERLQTTKVDDGEPLLVIVWEPFSSCWLVVVTHGSRGCVELVLSMVLDRPPL
ncbi:hypothetical protein E6O75_ATG08809 [Venturia nashicola]|uniref:Uncharacterized protein n=1 Tax=Venturia nashicola TaxID=86259 RepID=A0A4Z1NGU9_9PEZI|nr:hypothetical protein E6O75_ATG08809 [Venturia nashicola]